MADADLLPRAAPAALEPLLGRAIGTAWRSGEAILT
jgi:hypothetical protein